MEVVEVLFKVLWCIVEIASWSSDGNNTASARRDAAKPHHETGRDTPVDAEALARFVSDSPTREGSGGGPFLGSSARSHPLWHRELEV